MPDKLTFLKPALEDSSRDPLATSTPDSALHAENASLPSSVAAWAATPIEDHLARWKFEITEGLRDAEGRWIAEPGRRRRFSS
jgi:hypothetical protein